MQVQFEKVLEDHKGIILRFCSIYTSGEEDRKDLFQEIIFSIWKSLPRFRGDSALSTWIYKVALRTALEYSRKNKRRAILKENFIELTTTTDSDEADDNLELLRVCISGLNKADKILVTLYLEELPYREIGNILGITENLVAVKMKRIRDKLFQCINIKNHERS